MQTNFNRNRNCCRLCANEIIGNKLRLSYDEVKEYIESFNYKLLSNSYKDNKTKLEIQCSQGHLFKMSFDCFKNKNYRCPICSHKLQADQQRFIIDDVKIMIENLGYKLIATEYINCDTPISIQCKNNHITNISLKNLQNGKGCRICAIHRRSKENSYLWKGGITPLTQQIRQSLKYAEWRKQVFERDDYTCQRCLQKGNKLQAHHIENCSSNEDLRFDVNNGITLCKKCHLPLFKDSFHNLYGCINNNRSQIEEYINKNITERSDIAEIANLL